MKLNRKLLACGIASLSLIACSTTTNAGNYVSQMNQPAPQGGDVNKIQDMTLNPAAMNSLKMVYARNFELLSDGNYALNRGDGTIFLRASVINEGKNTVQAKWRCKFYDGVGIPIGDTENKQAATTPTGLGWHIMVVYPVNSKSITDDENVISCVAPTKRAVEGRIELHDMTNDITLYK